jgi:hypothetical protein
LLHTQIDTQAIQMTTFVNRFTAYLHITILIVIPVLLPVPNSRDI